MLVPWATGRRQQVACEEEIDGHIFGEGEKERAADPTLALSHHSHPPAPSSLSLPL